ncbi:uncharacterized protein LOC114359689 [Ostrinia furnacalis]|uniref:uncharacterized protein LOC114359689 n=1 Tax=Ostrinia furnacalis TaxID=93504 RepID=UPI001040C3FB|nr:uncharacterized protein LOC114359689 [Ostrinia furnacalis]
MLSRFVVSQVKHNSYFLVGVVIGLWVALAAIPLEEEVAACAEASTAALSDEFEPHREEKPLGPAGPAAGRSVQRPRYYSTELGMRGSLLAGVLSSEDALDSRVAALNQTAARLQPAFRVFIAASSVQAAPGRANVVGFTDTREMLKPFHALKYLADNYLEEYNFFFLVSDTSFVNARRLSELVSKLSVSQDVYMGTIAEDDSHYCTLEGGILLSNSVLRAVHGELDWCVRNSYSPRHHENIGRCVLHAAHQRCTTALQGESYSSARLEEGGALTPALADAVTTHPVSEPALFYRLHAYVSRVFLERDRASVARLRAQLVHTAARHPRGYRNATWPAGLRADPGLAAPPPDSRSHIQGAPGARPAREGGILLSNSVLRAVHGELDWCVRNSYSPRHHENIGRCVLHAAHQRCTTALQGESYSSARLEEGGSLTPALADAVTTHPVSEPALFYRLHAYVSRVFLERDRASVARLRAQLVHTAARHPRGYRNATWPAGLRADPGLAAPPPDSRFDHLRWTLFNESHAFMPDDHRAVGLITGATKEALELVLRTARAWALNRWPEAEDVRLLEGAWRWEPPYALRYRLLLHAPPKQPAQAAPVSRILSLHVDWPEAEDVRLLEGAWRWEPPYALRYRLLLHAPPKQPAQAAPVSRILSLHVDWPEAEDVRLLEGAWRWEPPYALRYRLLLHAPPKQPAQAAPVSRILSLHVDWPEAEDVRLLEGAWRWEPPYALRYRLLLHAPPKQPAQAAPSIRSLEVVRGLGAARLAAAPYVTEAARVTLLLPLDARAQPDLPAFLRRLEPVCLAQDKNTQLVVVSHCSVRSVEAAAPYVTEAARVTLLLPLDARAQPDLPAFLRRLEPVCLAQDKNTQLVVVSHCSVRSVEAAAPYVTEAARVTLLLPLDARAQPDLPAFLRRLEPVCLAQDKNTQLVVVSHCSVRSVEAAAPYVTEAARVTLLLPLDARAQPDLPAFLRRLEPVCLAQDKNTQLVVVSHCSVRSVEAAAPYVTEAARVTLLLPLDARAQPDLPAFLRRLEPVCLAQDKNTQLVVVSHCSVRSVEAAAPYVTEAARVTLLLPLDARAQPDLPAFLRRLEPVCLAQDKNTQLVVVSHCSVRSVEAAAPYVTEAARVTLLLPLDARAQPDLPAFLRRLEPVCLAQDKNTQLVVVVIRAPGEDESALEATRAALDVLSARHRGASLQAVGAALAPAALPDHEWAQRLQKVALSMALPRLSKDTLILLSVPHMEFNQDFLNRVRMNTIAGWQWYWALPFARYAQYAHPRFLDERGARPQQHTGRFATRGAVLAFYRRDWDAALAAWSGSSEAPVVEVLAGAELRCLRAPDPALVLAPRPPPCRLSASGPSGAASGPSGADTETCLRAQSASGFAQLELGDRHALAKLLLEERAAVHT